MGQEHKDREEAKKRIRRRVAAGIGAGLMATGAGLSGVGLWKTRPSAIRAQAAREQRALSAIKRGPMASKPLDYFKSILRKKGYPYASQMERMVPPRGFVSGNVGVLPAPFNRLIGGSHIAEKALEHEAGHLVGKKQVGMLGRFLGMHGLNYRRNIRGPEVDAWRQAKPGTTRRDMRRAALSVYKGAGPIIQGRALFRAGLLPLAAGAGLTGGALWSARKDLYKQLGKILKDPIDAATSEEKKKKKK